MVPQEERLNIFLATVVSVNKHTYTLRLSISPWGTKRNTVVELNVPVFYKDRRHIFGLVAPNIWGNVISSLAEHRAYYNRGKATILGLAIPPVFKDISIITGHRARDRLQRYLESPMHKAEVEENRIIMRNVCHLPDEIFREIMEFVGSDE